MGAPTMLRMHRALKHTLAIAFAACANLSPAQQVYRCESGGHISYSHEPCLGAQAVDTTPTQGMNKMTGITKKGADVQRDENRRLLNGIASQITGLSPETHARLGQRHKLSRSAQLECSAWDLRLPALEQAASQASPAKKAQADSDLFQARLAFRDLRC